jgi:hypothetical protein
MVTYFVKSPSIQHQFLRMHGKERPMKDKTIAVSLLSILAVVMITSCAALEPARHEYFMRGQVLEMVDGNPYLCIGKAEGAQVGQVYSVVRFERTSAHGPKPSLPHYRRRVTASVEILELVGEHYALARVISGDVRPNDIVELR